MSAPRLTFLYPFLFAPAKPVTVRSASRTARRALTTSGRRRQPAAHQRYGAANEPPPHLGSAKNVKEQRFTPPKDAKDSLQPKSEFQKERDLETASEEALRTDTAENSNNKKKKKKKAVKPHATEDAPAIEVLPPTTNLPPSPIMDASESMPISGPSPQPRIHAKPLETVLNMPSSDITGTPTSPVYQSDTLSTFHPPSPDTEPQGETFIQEERPQPLEQQKPPHISTPPYVHHFDTYGLVRRLEEGGWTQEQAITLMKAVRLILNENMDLARHGLVSKSNVENETYLFSAACSELKTEIQTKRNKEGERSRTERTQLQHEVDILGQRMTQESATMKDELKGMFDDRKMFVRNDQRDMERKIQELNYRITVSLNSDSRSDVEGVRWLITKRAISALAICVAMILGSLKFASSVAQWQEDEKKQLAAARKKHQDKGIDLDRDNSPKASKRSGNNDGNSNGSGNGGGVGPGALLSEIGQGEIFVQQGDNPAFVSLG